MAQREYYPGHIKRDPVTNYAAYRTSHPDDGSFGAQPWLIPTPNMGCQVAATTAMVDHWDDVYDAPAPEPETPEQPS